MVAGGMNRRWFSARCLQLLQRHVDLGSGLATVVARSRDSGPALMARGPLPSRGRVLSDQMMVVPRPGLEAWQPHGPPRPLRPHRPERHIMGRTTKKNSGNAIHMKRPRLATSIATAMASQTNTNAVRGNPPPRRGPPRQGPSAVRVLAGQLPTGAGPAMKAGSVSAGRSAIRWSSSA